MHPRLRDPDPVVTHTGALQAAQAEAALSEVRDGLEAAAPTATEEEADLAVVWVVASLAAAAENAGESGLWSLWSLWSFPTLLDPSLLNPFGLSRLLSPSDLLSLRTPRSRQVRRMQHRCQQTRLMQQRRPHRWPPSW